jgi:signal transduction histidine kinase
VLRRPIRTAGLLAATLLAASLAEGSGLSDALRSPLGLTAVLALTLFDTGRPSTWIDRWVTVPAFVGAVLLFIAILLLGPVTLTAWSGVSCLDGCASTGLSSPGAPGVQDFLELVYAGLRGLVFVGCGVGLALRMLRSRGLQRAVLTPIAVGGAVVVSTGAALTLYGILTPSEALPTWLEPIFVAVRVVVPIAVPAALFIAFAARGRLAQQLHALRWSSDTGEVRFILREVLDDPSLDVRVALEPDPGPGVEWTPLSGADGRAVGWLVHRQGLAQQEPMAFDVAVVAAASALELLGVGTRVDQLEADLAQARRASVHAADTERRRVEQDIHDGVQARIVLLRGHLRRLARDGAPASSALRSELSRLVQQVDAALAEIRSIGAGIRPVQPGSLVNALREDVLALRLPVKIADEGVGVLPGDVEVALHYVLREALQNVMKHAGDGARVEVTLGRDTNGCAWVEVRDDGAGFAPGADPGRGIVGMRHRVESLGGLLAVTAAPGAGTVVHALVPCQPGGGGPEVRSR